MCARADDLPVMPSLLAVAQNGATAIATAVRPVLDRLDIVHALGARLERERERLARAIRAPAIGVGPDGELVMRARLRVRDHAAEDAPATVRRSAVSIVVVEVPRDDVHAVIGGRTRGPTRDRPAAVHGRGSLARRRARHGARLPRRIVDRRSGSRSGGRRG